MKKILWFLVALALAAGLYLVFAKAWNSTKYFHEKGRDATLKVGRKYNASRWSSPLPIKKIHSYLAVLSPDHEVLIESDQDLKEGTEIFVRFLLRDAATAAEEAKLWKFTGSIRLKSEADGTPVRLKDTNIFDRTVEKAMGPLGEGAYVPPVEVAENAPDRDKPTVPFLIAGAQDAPLEMLWNNTSVGEWIILGFWVLLIKMIVLHAWSTPFNPNRTGADKKGFVHPSLRRVESADAAPKPKVTVSYVPKPEDHDYIGVAKPATPPPAPAPAAPPPPPAKVSLLPGAADPNAPKPQPTEPYSTTTTAAPFVAPDDNAGPSLKLTRKPKPAAGTTPPTPPAGDTPKPDA